MLFMCGDEVEVVWVWIDLVIVSWEVGLKWFEFYDFGISGLDEVLCLLYCDNCCWREIRL